MLNQDSDNSTAPSDKPVTPINLVELLREIRKKPRIYLGNNPTISQIRSLIVGFQSGSFGRGKSQEGDGVLDAFTSWVCMRFGVPDSGMAWDGQIRRHCEQDDEAAFGMFFELLEEYLKERERIGPDEIQRQYVDFLAT